MWDIRGSQRSDDIDADVQGRLGDVSLEGAHNVGVVGVNLDVFGQEFSGENVCVG